MPTVGRQQRVRTGTSVTDSQVTSHGWESACPCGMRRESEGDRSLPRRKLPALEVYDRMAVGPAVCFDPLPLVVRRDELHTLTTASVRNPGVTVELHTAHRD